MYNMFLKSRYNSLLAKVADLPPSPPATDFPPPPVTEDAPAPATPTATGGSSLSPPPATAPKKAKIRYSSDIFELQKNLLEYGKKNNLSINLGNTGKGRNGVDGYYGKLTRQAVKQVAGHLGIGEPLDANRRPTDAFKAALGGALKAPSGQARSPGESPPAEAAPAERPHPSFATPDQLINVDVGGKRFNMGAFIGGLPEVLTANTKDGVRVPLSPVEALRRLHRIYSAINNAGLSISLKIPEIAYLKDPGELKKAKEELDAVVRELHQKIDLLDVAILSTVKAKRKSLGLEPDPVSKGAAQEGYESELAYTRLPTAVRQGLQLAYGYLKVFLDEKGTPEKQNPRSLRELIVTALQTAAYTDFNRSALTENDAIKIGQILMNASPQGFLGSRINPDSPGIYFQGNDQDQKFANAWGTEFRSNFEKISPILFKKVNK